MPVKVGLKHIELWNSSMEKAVLKYETENFDELQDQIVFYGPSNFTRWASEKWGMTPLREVLVGRSGAPCCVNRGFGSSCPEHQLYYYPRMVRPLSPRVLVYASYGNSEAFGYTPEEAWELAQRVIAYTRTDFPECRIYLCSSNPRRDEKPESRRWAERFDSYVKAYAEENGCTFLNARAAEGLADPANFVEDGVHFNQRGYDIYAAFFRKALADELDRY